MSSIEERHLEYISKSPCCWQFKPKGQRSIVPLLVPPTFSLKHLSLPLHALVLFRLFCSCFSFSSFLIFFNHSLSSFPNPLSLSTCPLAFFYQVQTTCLPSCSFGETIFSTDAKLLLNQSTCSNSISTTIYYVFFSVSSIHSGLFFLLIHCLLSEDWSKDVVSTLWPI